MYMYICICMCTCMYMYIYMYIYIYICIRTWLEKTNEVAFAALAARRIQAAAMLIT